MGLIRYWIENCILKGNNINAYFNTSPRKGITWLRNPCSELVSDIRNPLVVTHQENFPRKELLASNPARAGAGAGVNTAAWGCTGTPRAWQSALGREQAGCHPRKCHPSRYRARAQLVGWAPCSNNKQWGQIRVEKLKGNSFTAWRRQEIH